MSYLTPKEAAHSQCIECLGMKQFNSKIVKNCMGDKSLTGPCPLFPYRLSGRVPLKVLRKFCLQCQGASSFGVEECEAFACPLHRYRFGKNPAMASRKGYSDSLKKWRERGDSTGKKP